MTGRLVHVVKVTPSVMDVAAPVTVDAVAPRWVPAWWVDHEARRGRPEWRLVGYIHKPGRVRGQRRWTLVYGRRA